MLSYASFLRIIRRRLVLGLIFGLSLTYCAFSLLRNEKKILRLDNDLDDMDGMMVNDNNEDLMSDDDGLAEQFRISEKPPLWQMEVLNDAENDNSLNTDMLSNLNDSDVNVQSCRNSIQGKVLIVDERGLICARHEVLPNGCCSTELKESVKNDDLPSVARRERYSCKTCNAQGCCSIYEYCVSCCLHPAKSIKRRKDPGDSTHKNNEKSKDNDAVRTRLRNLDRFQICLAACRTSSASVTHGRTMSTYKDPHYKHCYIRHSQHPHRHRRDANALNNNNVGYYVVEASSVVQLLTSILNQSHCSHNYTKLYNFVDDQYKIGFLADELRKCEKYLEI